MRSWIGAALTMTLLTGCETNRWISADIDTVVVGDASYQVRWIGQPPALDMQVVRAELLILGPDMLREQQRAGEAALIKARTICRTPAPQIQSTAREDLRFLFRVGC